MVKDPDGLVLKVLETYEACRNWIRKHYPKRPKGMTVESYYGNAGVCDEFDRQMALGTTDTDAIACMLWYGGVSRTRDVDGSGHFVGAEQARKAMNKRHKRA